MVSDEEYNEQSAEFSAERNVHTCRRVLTHQQHTCHFDCDVYIGQFDSAFINIQDVTTPVVLCDLQYI